jgi:hypothetical protein
MAIPSNVSENISVSPDLIRSFSVSAEEIGDGRPNES